MSLLKPPGDLKGHCTAIINDTLYIFTPKKFFSLPLRRNATWTDLPMGQSVEGAACVKGSIDGNPNNQGLYIVGGKSDSADYLGIQRYSPSNQKWEVVKPVTKDIQNRVDHAAIYIKASASILVYAGSQDGSKGDSTQSFLVSITPPYNVRSFNSYVPPAYRPLLLPWSEDKVAMVGGSPHNKQVFAFNAADGWHDTGALLMNPLPERSKVQCGMVLGADGSRILEVFDMNAVPNTVNRYVLSIAGGAPAGPGQQIGASSETKGKSATKKKREIKLDSYPQYNATFAPKTSRNDFSLAQDGNGVVAISGGDEKDPLAFFDQSTNSWLDSVDFLGGPIAKSTSPTGTPVTSGTPNSRTSSSPTDTISVPPPSSADGPKRHTMTIIGATLGALLGVAALLIILLLLIGWGRRNRKQNNSDKNKRSSKNSDDYDFHDRGIEPLAQNARPMARGPIPSTDSWGMVTRQFDEKPQRPPYTSFSDFPDNIEKGRSPLRHVETHTNDADLPRSKSTYAIPNYPDEKRDRYTDEGWSKYFQGDVGNQYGHNSPRSTMSSQHSRSDYQDSSWPEPPAEISALRVGSPGHQKPLGQVASGSPSTEHIPGFGTAAAQHGMQAKISSGDSISIASDDYDDDHPPAHVTNGAQEPLSMTAFGAAFAQSRVSSSTYSASLYPTRDSESLVLPTTNSYAAQESEAVDSRTRGPQLSSDISWLNLGKSR